MRVLKTQRCCSVCRHVVLWKGCEGITYIPVQLRTNVALFNSEDIHSSHRVHITRDVLSFNSSKSFLNFISFVFSSIYILFNPLHPKHIHIYHALQPFALSGNPGRTQYFTSRLFFACTFFLRTISPQKDLLRWLY